MKLKHDDKELDVKFTFNSFKLMEDLDFGELAELDIKPFKVIGITQTLLMGGLNYHPNKSFDENEVIMILEDVLENGDIASLLEELILELEKSSFFKNLQKKQEK